MAMSTPKKVALGSAGAALLGLGIAVPAIAAADPTPSPSSSSSSSATDPRAQHQQQLAEALAAELGLPVDKVSTALANAEQKLDAQRRADHRAELKTRLDQAVAADKLTQAQADAILAAYDAGVFPGPAGHGFGGPGR